MSTSKTIYIAPRSDNLPGEGTRANPFNGSTADKFDALMRKHLKPKTEIDLIPWTGTNEKAVFQTTGSENFNSARGYFVPDDCKILGPGSHIVEVQQVDERDCGGNARVVFEMDYQAKGNVRVAGLTIDEGGRNCLGKGMSTGSVRLYGDACHISDIVSRHGYGDRASGSEAFLIARCAAYWDGRWQDNKDGLIESCRVENFLGDYGIAFAAVPGGDMSGSSAGTVRYCEAEGFRGTAPIGLGSRNSYIGNIMRGCVGGFYGDTAPMEQIQLLNNECYDTHTRYPIHVNPTGAAIARGIQMLGNTLQCHAAGICVALSAEGSGHQFAIEIQQNNFLAPVNAIPNEQAWAIVFAWVDGYKVLKNNVHPSLKSALNQPQYPSTNPFVKGNIAVPEGLEDNA